MATIKPDLTRVWANGAPPANVVDPDTTTPGKVLSGWQAEVPPFEHFNFLQKWFTQGLAHFNEQGIGVWDTDTVYPIGGLAKGSDGELYKSLSEQNGNNPVGDDGSYWLRCKFSLLFDTSIDLKLTKLQAGQFAETHGYSEKGGNGAAKYFVKTEAQALTDGDALDGNINLLLANGNWAIYQRKYADEIIYINTASGRVASDLQGVTDEISSLVDQNISDIDTNVSHISALQDSDTAQNAAIVALQAGQTSGVIVFSTYALLDAYTPANPTEESGSFKVTNDPTTGLNGYYSWVSGTSYIKNASLVENDIDPVNTSDAVSGYAVATHTQSLTDSLSVGKNLFDKIKITEGGYYDGAGNFVANAAYFGSDKIALGVGTYTISPIGTFVNFYEDEFNPPTRNLTNQTTVTLSGNEKFIQISVGLSVLDELQLEAGGTATVYEPFSWKGTERLTVPYSQITDKYLLESTRPEFVVGKNIFNYRDNTEGFYIDSFGALIPDAGRSYTGLVPVEAGQVYSVTTPINFISFYNSAGSYLSNYSPNTSPTFTPPTDAVYAIFSGVTSTITSQVQQVEKGGSPTAFESYSKSAVQATVKVNQIEAFDAEFAVTANEQGYALKGSGINLYDPSKREVGFYPSPSDSSYVTDANQATSGYIPVEESTLYSWAYSISKNPIAINFIHFYDIDKVWISSNPTGQTDLSTPANTAFIRFGGGLTDMAPPAKIQLNKGEFTDFERFRLVVKAQDLNVDPLMNIKPSYSYVTVNSDSTASADYVGRRALQDAIDSITDATFGNQYVIQATGVFEAHLPEHFDVPGASGDNFIVAKDYVNVEGKDTFKIIGYLAVADSYKNTVLWNASASLTDCEIIALNNRYAIHIEGSGWDNKYMKREFTRVKLKSNGWLPLGYGESYGEQSYFDNCEFEALGSTTGTVYVHSNSNFKERCIVKFKNCNFIPNGGAYLAAQNLGAGWDDIVELDNCTVDGHLQIISSRNADYDNNPDTSRKLTVVNSLEPTPLLMTAFDSAIKIKSDATGAGSSVRVTGGTAFNDIFGDSSQVVEHQDYRSRLSNAGYSYLDGTSELSGYCLSGLDIQEHTTTIYRKPLGKRLGDCSTVNKTLTVVVDGGVVQTITFDKNYDGQAPSTAPDYDNASIVAEMNAALTGCVVSLYAYGSDYFPIFKDTEKLSNSGTTAILRGMGIVKTGDNTCRVAVNADSKIDGIAMHDADLNQYTVVVKSGSVFSQNKGTVYQTLEASTLNHSYGDELGIGADGVFDITASPKLIMSVGNDILRIL